MPHSKKLSPDEGALAALQRILRRCAFSSRCSFRDSDVKQKTPANQIADPCVKERKAKPSLWMLLRAHCRRGLCSSVTLACYLIPRGVRFPVCLRASLFVKFKMELPQTHISLFTHNYAVPLPNTKWF
jgi:hypothetical protein